MRHMRTLAMAFMVLGLWMSIACAGVSYLGPAGTYTEEAAVLFFGPDEPMTPAGNVAESLAMLKAGASQFAVVPVENAIGGPVYNYLDAVLEDKDLIIVGEVDLPIRQTLLGVPGAKLTDIKTVLSHPQGIAQSKAWITANLPEVKVVEVASTAEAAKRVAEAGDFGMAAIAASRTAGVYHLEILANDLQYTHTNVTRFWVVALQGERVEKGTKAAVVVSGSNHSVIALLHELVNQGYYVQSLHDRPSKEKLGEYQFVIEVEGVGSRAALEKLLNRPDLLLKGRVLGGFKNLESGQPNNKL